MDNVRSAYYEQQASLIRAQPMPLEYSNWRADVLCNDCIRRSWAPYHFLGHQCAHCNSFNTAIIRLDKRPPEYTPATAASLAADGTAGLLQAALRDYVEAAARLRQENANANGGSGDGGEVTTDDNDSSYVDVDGDGDDDDDDDSDADDDWGVAVVADGGEAPFRGNDVD